MITQAEALQHIATQATTYITPEDVKQHLATVRGTTFAQIVQVTPVATAAAHKAVNISKVTVANVQLFNNLREFTNAYVNAVKRSAAKLGLSDPRDVNEFTSQGNYFENTDCYSVVKHKTQEKYYLFVIYNKAESVYVMNNTVVDKQQVAQYLTPSAAKALLEPESTVHNVAQDVTHNVQVRTVKLENIVSIKACGYEL